MFIKRQKGVALIVFAILMLITVGSLYIANTRTSFTPKVKARMDSQYALSQARDALMAFSLGYYYNAASPAVPPATVPFSNILGRLPFPDRNQDTPTRDYNGESDCITGALQNNHLIGKFPWRREGTPCPNFEINLDVRDSSGERLWYAVSRNMVRHNSNTAFNSDTLNITTNWITVYDQFGNILSNRVAFVLLAPGKSINGQRRTAIAPAIRYLDSFNVPGVGVVNNYDAIPDFVIADESNTFNDQLIYVTIDQLMPLIEKRVLSEFRSLLGNHQTTNGAYPWPALLGDQNNDCDNTLTSGFIAISGGAIPCPAGEFLTIPGRQDYLNQWLPFIYYAVRSDCVGPGGNVAGCGNQVNGNELSLDGINNRDVVLIMTSNAITTLATATPPHNQDRTAVVPPAQNRQEYLDEQLNIDQNYVTPVTSTNNNDQITSF